MIRFLPILFLLFSCTKVEYVLQSSTYSTGAKSIELIGDTTINGTWDGAGKVITIHNYKIHGKGTFQNWDIDASLNQNIFDTSLNLKNIKCSNGPFSTIWLGVNSANADNWWNLQKSINICRDNNLPCFTPGNGIYKYSKPLEIAVLSNGKYQQTSLHFYGDASYWNNGNGTTFQYTGKQTPALNLQLNKGSELDHFVLMGLFRSPVGKDSVYFNTTEANYKDISGNNLNDYYTGIAIDYRVSGTASGSTGTYIHEVSLAGFAMGLAMSQGDSYNDDNMTVDHLYFMDNLKYCIVNGQAQEKGMHFTNIYSWGSVYDVINIGLHNRQQAGNYSFDGVYIAGRCIQPFDVSVSHWYGQTFNNVFAESIARIGNFSSAGQTIIISNSTFDLTYPKTIGRQIIINSNANQTEFDHCTIRYFDDLNTDIWVHGYMTFGPNCYFGGGKIIYK